MGVAHGITMEVKSVYRMLVRKSCRKTMLVRYRCGLEGYIEMYVKEMQTGITHA
jgi:hypothetical protein